MLAILGSHMSPCAGPLPGLCSVCKYLQGQARDNLQQSVTPGHRSRSRAGHTAQGPRWWHWDLIVSRSPGYHDTSVQLSVLSSFTPHHHRLRLRDVLRAPRPELVNVRELGQWQRAKWNDITQVAEYFINPAPAHRPLSETKQFYWTCIFSCSWWLLINTWFFWEKFRLWWI